MTSRRVILILLLSLLAGCTRTVVPATVQCQGKLLMNGQPLEVANRAIGLGQVTLKFIPVAAAGPTPQEYVATVDEAGNFSMPGGMPPGKYKVVVRQWDPYPNVDKLNGAFAEEKTTLIRTIDGQATIDIDLSRPD